MAHLGGPLNATQTLHGAEDPAKKHLCTPRRTALANQKKTSHTIAGMLMKHPHTMARKLWVIWIFALLITCVWDIGEWDLATLRHLRDANGFLLQQHPSLELWLHSRVRAVGWGAYFGAWFWAIFPHASLVSGRKDRLALMGMVTLNLLVINLMKYFSTTSCPWSLAEWGGVAQYVSHWQWGITDGGPGRCFPSGHAATAWAFSPLVIAAWWPLLQTRHVKAAVLMSLVLCIGALLASGTQALRGAHYPSHAAWTAVICWGLSLVYWTLRQNMNRTGHRRG